MCVCVGCGCRFVLGCRLSGGSRLVCAVRCRSVLVGTRPVSVASGPWFIFFGGLLARGAGRGLKLTQEGRIVNGRARRPQDTGPHFGPRRTGVNSVVSGVNRVVCDCFGAFSMCIWPV